MPIHELFPEPNPRLAQEKCRFPDASLVAVHWLDASFDSNEKIIGELPSNYKAGIVDLLVGMYLGMRDGCIVISNSVYVGESRRNDSHRHIWNIPVDMIINIEPLVPSSSVK